ncbi:hypothetical protein PC122_g18398 [Phytophthora cactorum]|nr:hypothetical protein PC122_g18398 [Phytophthora cactorum]
MIRSDVAWVHDGAHGLQHDTLIVDAEEAAEALFRTSCRDLPGARHFGRWTLKRPRASWRCARWTSTASPRRISSLQISGSGIYDQVHRGVEGGRRPVYGSFEFQRTSIFRPGMLERGDLLRGTEKMLSRMIGAYQITVRAVAKGMVSDYESGAEGLKEWSHADLTRFE